LGWNYRITEFQAAILLAQLERLEEEVEKKDKNAQYLHKQLENIEGIKPMKRRSQVDRQSYYDYLFRYEKKYFNNVSAERFAKALNAEGIPCRGGILEVIYKTPRWVVDPREFPFTKGIDYNKISCPVAEKACFLGLNHRMLLGEKEDMNDIALAVRKIKDNIGELEETS